MLLNHKNKKLKSKNIILAVAVLLVAAIAGGYIYLFPHSPAENVATVSDPTKINDVNYGKATDEQISAGYEAKKQSLEPTPTPSPSASSPAPQISIVSKQIDSKGKLSVTTMIDTIADGGICIFTMTKPGSTTVTQEAGTQSLGSYSVCKGFDIPTDNLDKGGWTITIKYQKDTATSSTTGVVTVS